MPCTLKTHFPCRCLPVNKKKITEFKKKCMCYIINKIVIKLIKKFYI